MCDRVTSSTVACYIDRCLVFFVLKCLLCPPPPIIYRHSSPLKTPRDDLLTKLRATKHTKKGHCIEVDNVVVVAAYAYAMHA